ELQPYAIEFPLQAESGRLPEEEPDPRDCGDRYQGPDAPPPGSRLQDGDHLDAGFQPQEPLEKDQGRAADGRLRSGERGHVPEGVSLEGGDLASCPLTP